MGDPFGLGRMRSLVSARLALSFALSVAGPVDAQEPALGQLSFPTSGKPSAQRPFIRGVLYLHSFEYDSAAAQFRAAQRLDPGFAMAYWGEAMTYTHPVWMQQDAAAARAVLARMARTREARRAKAPTDREKRYLDAVEILYGEGGKERRDTLYSREMERLSADFPKDDEARSFFALSLLGLFELRLPLGGRANVRSVHWQLSHERVLRERRVGRRARVPPVAQVPNRQGIPEPRRPPSRRTAG